MLSIDKITDILSRHRELTAAEIMRFSGYCASTVYVALQDSRFRRVGVRATGAAGKAPLAYALAEKPVSPVRETPVDPAIDKMLNDQAERALAIRVLARGQMRLAARELARVWLAVDANFKRTVAG